MTKAKVCCRCGKGKGIDIPSDGDDRRINLQKICKGKLLCLKCMMDMERKVEMPGEILAKRLHKNGVDWDDLMDLLYGTIYRML